jgi:hypothetical protein
MLNDVLPNLFSRDLTVQEQGRVDQYTAALVNHMEFVALSALSNRQPAHLLWGQGSVGFAYNRRTSGGPVDRDMPLLCVKSPEGDVRALFVNYACHCTTLGAGFNEHHGDWAGEAQARMEQDHPGAIALVAIGCGGDANPHPRSSLSYAQQHGQSIATEASRLLLSPLKTLASAPQGQVQFLQLPFVTLPTRVEWEARALQPGIVGYHAQKNLARLNRGETLPTSLPYSVQTWAFGEDLALVFLPGEVVVDYALRLKSIYDRDRLWVNGYANDVPCYIPSVRILNEGGYEAETSLWYYDRPAKLAPATEDLIVNAMCAQLPDAFLPRPDTRTPILISAASLDGKLIGARFDRAVHQESAELPACYQLSPAAIITNVALRADGRSVAISLQNATASEFTLAADGVMGAYSNSARSEVVGAVLPLVAQDVGNPVEPSSVIALGYGDFSVHAGGRDVWDQSDDFNFIHQSRTGDFDVRVQVASFIGTASSAKAALMVRESLASGSRHFTLTVYPAQGNWTAFWRLNTGGTSAVAAGNWRINWPGINYPNIWMRLKRVGDEFTLYGGGNGHDWVQVADSFTPSPAYPAAVMVGLATTSMSDKYPNTPAADVEYLNFGDIGLPTRPVLDIKFDSDVLYFSWPAPASDFLLQHASVLDPIGAWTGLSHRPGFFNGRCVLTLPAPSGSRFFRLMKP